MPVEIGERHVRLRGDLQRGNPAAADRIAGRVAKRRQLRTVERQGHDRAGRPGSEVFYPEAGGREVDRPPAKGHKPIMRGKVRVSLADETQAECYPGPPANRTT